MTRGGCNSVSARRPLIVTVLLGLAAAPVTAQPAEPPKEARELLEDCTAHRFDTVVSAVVDGQLKRSRLRLCGTKGQSDKAWIGTLRDSAGKIAINEGIAPAMRSEMVKALNTEIASLEARQGAASASVGAGKFDLKPRAVPPPAARDVKSGYNALPPLPPPVTVKTVAGPYVPPPPIARPELDFECFSTGSGSGEGPCIEFDRYTVVVVRAKAPVAPGSMLRFVRDGEELGEVALGALKAGQRQRVALPTSVCKGVVGGSLKIETLATPQGAQAAPRVASELGPFNLSCT